MGGARDLPPQVLDVADTYFSREIPITKTTPAAATGRSAQGVRSPAPRFASRRCCSAGQLLLDRSGIAKPIPI